MLIRNSSVIMRVKFDPLRIEELPNWHSERLLGQLLDTRLPCQGGLGLHRVLDWRSKHWDKVLASQLVRG